MKQLRPYQETAVQECWEKLKESSRPVLLMASVGAGKSLMLAKILLTMQQAGKRALCLVNNAELVRNNCQALIDEGGDASIYCAALGSKDASAPIVFGTPQSVLNGINKNEAVANIKFNIIVVDEAHAINYLNHQSCFMRILRHYKQEYKDMRVLGATGTNFRFKGAAIVGDDCLFKSQVGNITTEQLINDGYLVNPNFEIDKDLMLDFSNVRIKQNGQFDQKQLELVIERSARLTELICHQVVHIMESQKRFGVFFFATTKKHAFEILSHLPMGESAIILGETPQHERTEILDKARSGSIKYLVNIAIVSVGVDVPAYDTIAYLRPTESLVLLVQTMGRALRLSPKTNKDNCIAEGQLVLTDAGLVPIEKITKQMKLWDGLEFVSHCGIVFRGKQEVVTYAGITATKDHKVWTKEGWKEIGLCAIEQTSISITGDGEFPIQLASSCFSRNNSKKTIRKGIFKNKVRSMQKRIFTRVYLFKSKESRMQAMWASSEFRQASSRCSTLFDSEMYCCKTTMYESKRFELLSLRSKRNSIQIQKSKRNGSLDIRQSWGSKTLAYRQNKQQWPLRTRKSENYHVKSKYEQQETQQWDKEHAPISSKSSRNKIFGFNVNRNVQSRNDIRTNNRKILQEIKQAKRPVWDILNSGPRNRFTCQGLLVSNCLVLDFAGNIERHRDWDNPILLEAVKKTIDQDKPLVICCPACCEMNTEHARRCVGLKDDARCQYYFEFKECVCGAQNDIAARLCHACHCELIDPNEKLSMARVQNKLFHVDVLEASYGISGTQRGFRVNCAYKCRDESGRIGSVFEHYSPVSERAAIVFYGQFVKKHCANASQYYMYLNDRSKVEEMLHSADVPVSLLISKEENGTKIKKKIFN